MLEGSDNVDGATTRADTSLFTHVAVGAAILGFNLWAVTLFVPWLTSEPVEPPTSAWIVGAPLLLLVAGASMRSRSRLSTAFSLFGFPVAIGIGIAFLPRWTAGDPYSTPGIVLGALSFLAYAAAASAAATDGAPRIPIAVHPVTMGPVPTSWGRRWIQPTVVLVLAAGGFVLTTVGPRVADGEAFVRTWGDGAPEASTFVAVTSVMLAVSILTLVLAPAMRRSSLRAPKRRTTLRVLALLWAALLGGLLYVSLKLGAPPSALLP